MGLATYFSTFGTISSIFLLLSPLPSYHIAVKLWVVTSISFEFILASNVSQIAWVLYGLETKQMEILVPSVAGTIVTCVYLVVHRVIVGGTPIFLLTYLSCSLFSVAIAIKLMSITVLGWLCMLLSVANSLAALFQTKAAIKEKDPTLIDSNITVAMTVCAVCWAGFGIVKKDVFILIPNVVGVLVALVNFFSKRWLQDQLPACPQCFIRWGRRYKKSLQMNQPAWV